MMIETNTKPVALGTRQRRFVQTDPKVRVGDYIRILGEGDRRVTRIVRKHAARTGMVSGLCADITVDMLTVDIA